MIQQLTAIIFISIVLVQYNVAPQPDIKVWGPGLNPYVVLPARYFFVQSYENG